MPVPEGYLSDSGQPFGRRAGGMVYGWSSDHTDQLRQRTDDPLRGTLCHFLDGQAWEIAVPNGTYEVTVCVGDLGYDVKASVNVCTDLVREKDTRTITKSVVVDDGRLTIDNGESTGRLTKINYITITRKQ